MLSLSSSTHFVQAQSVIDERIEEFRQTIEDKLREEVFSKFAKIMVPGRVYKTSLLRHELYDLTSLYGTNYFGDDAYIVSYRLYYLDITEQKERAVGS